MTSILYKIRSVLPNQALRNIYCGLVYPHTLYGIELYGCADAIRLDKLIKRNNKILCICHGKNLDCPLIDLYSAYCTLPIPALYEFKLLIFMFKNVHNNTCLPSIFRNNHIKL